MSERQSVEAVAHPLYTAEVLGVALCKYSAGPPEYIYETDATTVRCPERQEHQHPDEDCIVMFWSASAIATGNIPTTMVAPVVRSQDGDPTFVGAINP